MATVGDLSRVLRWDTKPNSGLFFELFFESENPKPLKAPELS